MSTFGGAVPIVFGAAQAWCFGWFHAARLPARGIGVVLCRPMGQEVHTTYDTYTQLAELLAFAGFAVVRFDYQGTGDSAGKDSDPDRVRAWIDSTKLAIEEVKRLGGVSRVALFGVRLGATLAARAASDIGGVESLVMWAPCATGRAFARELRASSVRRSSHEQDAGADDMLALGYTYTAQTIQDLNTLDAVHLALPPASRVMLIGRDDLPAEGPLRAAYQAMGVDASYQVLPGYSDMMVEAHVGHVAGETLAAIVDWLSATPVAMPMPNVSQQGAVSQINAVIDDLRETPLFLGAEEKIFGVLTEPVMSVHPGDWAETIILMISIGANHRIGPNGLYVTLARSLAQSGCRSFRFDLPGVGDSLTAGGVPREKMYSKASVQDVISAMDGLGARGFKKFVVMGLCSSAYLAFQAALIDRRVIGEVLMNPRLLMWQDGDPMQLAMRKNTETKSHYKPLSFYRRALLDVDVYRRLLLGQIDVMGIARRMWVLLQVRWVRAVNNLLKPGPSGESVLDKLKILCGHGSDTLVIVAEGDEGLDYVEFHLGHQGHKMNGVENFRMVFVKDADHTFSGRDHQQIVIDVLQGHLKKVICRG